MSTADFNAKHYVGNACTGDRVLAVTSQRSALQPWIALKWTGREAGLP
jgi:hypothetical protein